MSKPPTRKPPRRKAHAATAARPAAPRPGDPTPAQVVERAIRVDHAGEYGAVRIYEGQLRVLNEGALGAELRAMLAAERLHLKEFERLMTQRRVRPTALLAFWHVAGYALGAATALLGERAAMACTVAVEEVIEDHYAAQIAALGESEPALKRTFAAFQAEEVAHRDAALASGARDAPGYALLTGAIRAGTRLAIKLSERI